MKLTIVTVVTLTLIIVNASADSNRHSTQCLVMPEELVELAEKNGFSQIEDFFTRIQGQTLPPYIYGYKRNLLPENSVAFWAKKNHEEDTTAVFFLIFAQTDYSYFKITNVVEWTYPIGLRLYDDTSAVLDSFLNTTDIKSTGPCGVKLRDFGVDSYYDGNSIIFYQYKRLVYVRFDSDL